MSLKELYNRFVRLCHRWPRDETKQGRDYGEFFRTQLTEHFPHGDLGQVLDPTKVAQRLQPLERLANNQYYMENPLKRSSASGLDVAALRDAISNEGLKAVQDQDESSLLNRLKRNLNMKFSQFNKINSTKKDNRLEVPDKSKNEKR